MHDTERLAELLAANDRSAAAELAAKLASSHPAAVALANAALEEKAPARAAIQIAALYVLSGNRERAIETARGVLAEDSSAETRRAVGGIFLAAGNHVEASTLLASVVAETPDDHIARQNLATAAFGRGDIGAALEGFATAFQLAPSDEAPIHALMEMCTMLGKWAGALAALERCRQGEPPPHVAVALDLAAVELMTRVAGRFPPLGADPASDRLVTGLVADVRGHAPAVRLAIARTLAKAERFMEAGEVLDGITGRRVLTPNEHADVQYMCGLLAERDGYRSTAIDRYTKAVAADPTHVDAAINATSLLLEDESADALAQVASVLEQVPGDVRAASAVLAFNEARYLSKVAQTDAARTCLNRVLTLAANNAQLTELARRALDELA